MAHRAHVTVSLGRLRFTRISFTQISSRRYWLFEHWLLNSQNSTKQRSDFTSSRPHQALAFPSVHVLTLSLSRSSSSITIRLSADRSILFCSYWHQHGLCRARVAARRSVQANEKAAILASPQERLEWGIYRNVGTTGEIRTNSTAHNASFIGKLHFQRLYPSS